MKKTLIFVMATVCIFASLLVSCSNETKLSDEPVSIRFGFNQSRGLNASQDIPEVDELVWYYQAKRTAVSDSVNINFGTTTGWTRVNPNSTGLDGIITLAQGRWDFELQGRKTTDESTAVYQGSISNVLILKDGNTVNTISVPVSQLTDGSGTVIISKDIIVKKNLSDDSGYKPTHYKYKATTAETYGADKALTKKEGKLVNTTIPLAAGTYDFVVMYKGIDTDAETNVETEIIYASSPITVTVSANIETMIAGSLEVVTASSQFGVEVVGSKATADVTPSEEEAVSVVVPITPGDEQGTDTTITFGEGALPSDATKVVTEVKTVEEALAANFNVTEGFTAVAAIDLKITDDSGIEKAVNDGKTVTVTTYILKGLSQNSLNLVYTGDLEEGMEHEVTGYDPETGKLVFQTNHFSEFFVESDAVCYVVETNTAYNADNFYYATNSTSPVTIEIISDFTVNRIATLTFSDGSELRTAGKYVLGSLNGNNHTITMPASETSDKVFLYYLAGTIKDLTIMNSVVVSDTISGACFDNVKVDGTINLGNSNNTGAFALYAFLQSNETLSFKGCNMAAVVTADGGKDNYNAAFVGYGYGAHPNAGSHRNVKLNFENCRMDGSLTSGVASVFLGNDAQLNTYTIEIKDFLFGENAFVRNVAKRPGCKFNGINSAQAYYGTDSIVIDDTTYNNNNFSELSDPNGEMPTWGAGHFFFGPNDSGIVISKNGDGPFEFTRSEYETSSESAKTVAYYKARISIYSTYKVGGSLLQSVEETIYVDDEADNYTTKLLNLQFVDQEWVDSNNPDMFDIQVEGITVYRDNNNKLYYMLPNNDQGTLNGTPKNASAFTIISYASDGSVISSNSIALP